MLMRTRGAAFQTLSCSSRRLQTRYSTGGTGSDSKTSPRDSLAHPTLEDTSTAETHAASSVAGQTQDSLTPPIDFETLRSRIKDWGVLASSSLLQRADHLSKTAATTFSHLGLHLNRVTGYEEIEALKRQVVAQEARIKATRHAAREAKTAYDDAVLQRSVSQRQVNDLLQRKSSWTDSDVSNFTSLVRSDHSFEQEEARAKARVAEMEDAVDREFSELMRVILARYHEEQVWSDKIRSASTYGSLAVLGVNLAVFIMAIIVVEPWKRKRLAQTFEKKVEEMGTETKDLVNAGAARLEERLAGHEKLLTELIFQVSPEAHRGSLSTATVSEEVLSEETPTTPPPLPTWWPPAYSYPDIRNREFILVAGGAIAGGVIAFLTHSLFTRS